MINIDSRTWVTKARAALRVTLVLGVVTGWGALVAVAAPVNDNFTTPASLIDFSAADMVSNVDASKEVDEPEHAGDPGGLSLWWIWTAPSDGLLTVSTAGSTA